jgi:hypothetical protein
LVLLVNTPPENTSDPLVAGNVVDQLPLVVQNPSAPPPVQVT